MKLIIISLLLLSGSLTQGIYSFTISSVDNSTSINLSAYQGKKILLVNIATGSDKVAQLGQLQQIYEQYSDSLVVIAVPSNSFGNETRSNSGIYQYCSITYSTSFPIATTITVKGDQIHPIYNWLTKASENGVMSSEVKDDFQKFLVSSNGELIGVFAGSMPANHPAIIDAITQ